MSFFFFVCLFGWYSNYKWFISFESFHLFQQVTNVFILDVLSSGFPICFCNSFFFITIIWGGSEKKRERGLWGYKFFFTVFIICLFVIFIFFYSFISWHRVSRLILFICFELFLNCCCLFYFFTFIFYFYVCKK